MLSVLNYAQVDYVVGHFAERHSAECHYTECHFAECCGAQRKGKVHERQKLIKIIGHGPAFKHQNRVKVTDSDKRTSLPR
jgi:hypothetical protein